MQSEPSKSAAVLALFAVAAVWTTTTLAGPPSGYYATVNTTNSTTLRTTLHPIIDDHQRFPYTSGATDTWDILELADEDPNDAGHLLDVYKNASYRKVGGGNDLYNREHTWPSSYGFPDDGPGNYPFTDCHMLFLCDSSYNSSRSNNPYRTCSAACSEKTTLLNNGQGGGSGIYPGNSNWRTGQGSGGTWETWIGRRGDVARAMFYMDIRYEGGTHGGTGFAEPDLILTNDGSLIVSNTQNNQPVAYMGILSVLLEWHEQDPVDELERDRNDLVFDFQENRNPFIDHPEWVACLFLDECKSCIDPACPIDMNCNGEVDSHDLALLLAAWGQCPGCAADLNGDGEVDPFDLSALLAAWGPCS